MPPKPNYLNQTKLRKKILNKFRWNESYRKRNNLHTSLALAKETKWERADFTLQLQICITTKVDSHFLLSFSAVANTILSKDGTG